MEFTLFLKIVTSITSWLKPLFSGSGTEVVKKILGNKEYHSPVPQVVVNVYPVEKANFIDRPMDEQIESKSLRRHEIAERLQNIVELIKKGYETSSFSITTMAELLGYTKVTPLEEYFSGTKEPDFHSLRKICENFGINYGWLNNGIGYPFQTTLNSNSDPLDYYDPILAMKPEQIYFIQCKEKERRSTVLIKLKPYHYCLLPRDWHISEHVGHTGARQIYSYYQLVKKLSQISDASKSGRILLPNDYSNLYSGKVFAGEILKNYSFQNYWWDDLLDITHQYSNSHRYENMYGYSFVYAQFVIKSHLEKETR